MRLILQKKKKKKNQLLTAAFTFRFHLSYDQSALFKKKIPFKTDVRLECNEKYLFTPAVQFCIFNNASAIIKFLAPWKVYKFNVFCLPILV